MKTKMYFYKWWFAGFRVIDFIPLLSLSKNVQGWSFTRVYSLRWLTYCFSIQLTKNSDLDANRDIAHERNVKRYT